MKSIGLIGLGNAGRPMAVRLLSKGFALKVYDKDPAAVARVTQMGGRSVESAREAAGDLTITLLPSSVEVRQVVFEENGIFAAMGPGKTLIDLSGTDPDCARELQKRFRGIGASFIGGTLHASGVPATAIPTGRFSIVVGGAKSEIEPVVYFLNQLAQTIVCLPEPWMPKAFKMAIILYATTNNIITAEICSWLTAQGADPKLFLKLLQTTGSRASAARLEEFLQRNNDQGGALSNSYKDFRQALQIAAELKLPMPLASMANQIQEMGRAHGFARFNSPAAMGKLYELLTAVGLSAAGPDAKERSAGANEPRVVYLD